MLEDEKHTHYLESLYAREKSSSEDIGKMKRLGFQLLEEIEKNYSAELEEINVGGGGNFEIDRKDIKVNVERSAKFNAYHGQLRERLNSHLPKGVLKVGRLLIIPMRETFDEIDDDISIEDYTSQLWNFLRILRLMKDSKNDFNVSDNKISLKLDANFLDNLDEQARYNLLMDTTVTLKSLGFGRFSSGMTQARLHSGELAEGIDLQLLKNFEENQELAISTRLKVLAAYHSGKVLK